MNWFHKLMITLVAFVGLMVYFAVRSVHTRLDLVTENYYEEELKYQHRINASAAGDTLSQKIQVQQQADGLQLIFPDYLRADAVSGEVRLYYPADSKKDQAFALKLGTDHRQALPTTGLRGAYTLQLNWSYDKQNYYTEQKIFL